MSSVVSAFDQANVNGIAPPTKVKSTDPLFEQDASVTTVEAEIPFGVFPIVNTSVAIEHPLLSVIVQNNVPDNNPVIEELVPPPDHK